MQKIEDGAGVGVAGGEGGRGVEEVAAVGAWLVGGEDGGGYHARSLQKRMRDKQPMFVRTPSHMLIEHSIMFVRVL